MSKSQQAKSHKVKINTNLKSQQTNSSEVNNNLTCQQIRSSKGNIKNLKKVKDKVHPNKNKST